MRKAALQSIGVTRTAVNYENMWSVCCKGFSKWAKVTKLFKGDKTELQGSIQLKKRKN